MSSDVRGSANNPYQIAVLSGDGAGPAVADAVKKVLRALAADADLHFDFLDAPYGEAALRDMGSLVPDSTLEVCRSADAVLRSYQGSARGDGPATSAHAQLRDKLGLFAQFRPVIVYPQLKHLSTLRADIVSDVDIMLVREISAGALATPNATSSTSAVMDNSRNQSVMEYTAEQVQAIAKVAVQIAEQRSCRVLNVDKADALAVSRFWRYHLHETVARENARENNRFMLSDMYVDDFVREVIHRPTDFDVVVTSNLFGDICAEVIDALAGPQRLSPSFWKSHDGLGVYGPADIYNLSAYPTAEPMDGPNAIALTRAASMMLRYELDEPAAANTIQQALRKTMADMAEDVRNDSPLLLENNGGGAAVGTAGIAAQGGRGGLSQALQQGDLRMSGVNGGSRSRNGGGAEDRSTTAEQLALNNRNLVKAFSKTSADEYADTIVRSMQLLKQFEQVCDPTECGE